MSVVIETVSAIISIDRFKKRHDSFTDLYNRLFMTKICVAFALLISINYYKDKTACIVTNTNGMSDKFVGAACWIRGFYIYEEMKDRLSESGYYGIPRNMDYDGLNVNNQLCTVKDRAYDHVHECEPMKKVYYLQFQYMPFFLASLALLFYAPYFIYKHATTDMISLKENTKKHDVTAEDIFNNYFNPAVNSTKRSKIRFLALTLVKFLYLLSNLIAFELCDSILNGKFRNYGINYFSFLVFSNFQQHDHDLKLRAEPKPGNVLLPPMGFCDIHEATRDVRNTFINQHRFICEISPHVLFQYVLLVFWLFLILGMFLSVIGLITHALSHVLSYLAIKKDDLTGKLYKSLEWREIDYLDYLRGKKGTLYADVVKKLKNCRGYSDVNKNLISPPLAIPLGINETEH